MTPAPVRHNWTLSECQALYNLPFTELLYQAQTVARQTFNPADMELCQLYNFQTGACPEDCKYCPQSVHYQTDVEPERFFEEEPLKEALQKAKERGVTRFCMAASIRRPSKRFMDKVIPLLQIAKSEGFETCLTMGSLTQAQSQELKEAGLDFYNHNLDTSPEYYTEIITTRPYEERLQTLEYVREAGLKTCCGGILGMGESVDDRLKLLMQLANMPEHPRSVPVNQLIPTAGTPLADKPPINPFDFVRIVACARIMMPKSIIRLSGNRLSMSDEMQALCFLAGANSMFVGEKLLTRQNCSVEHDEQLLAQLGFTVKTASHTQELEACL